MENVQIELRKWLSEYCGNVQEYEYQVRKLINLNKIVTSRIRSAYSSRDIEKIKELIKEFLIEKNIWIKTCNNCKKVNYISGKRGERILNRKCEQCYHFLYKNEKEEIEEFDKSTTTTKKCLYCNNPVTPPNTVTCYSHNNVGFNY